MSKILFILAAICFGLAALRVPASVDFMNAGFCLLTIGLLIL